MREKVKSQFGIFISDNTLRILLALLGTERSASDKIHALYIRMEKRVVEIVNYFINFCSENMTQKI